MKKKIGNSLLGKGWKLYSYFAVAITSVFMLMAMSGSCTSVNRIRVMSFNIHHDVDNWRGSRKNLVVRAINRENVDVVCLQEAYMSQVRELASKLPQFGYFGRGRSANGQGESVSILYSKERFNVDESQSGTFWFSNRPNVPGSKPGRKWGNPTLPRICTYVRLVQKSTNKALYIYNLHLQHEAGDDPELGRVRSVLLLTDRMRQRNYADPFLVTGDFNATPDQVPIRFLTEGNLHPIRYCPASGVLACHDLINLVPMIDTWSRVYPNSTHGTRCNGGSGTGKRIDYIFLDPAGGVISTEIGGKVSGMCPSDHAPVMAEVLLPLGG